MKIKVTSPSFSQNVILREELLWLFPEALFNETGKRYTSNELIEYLSDAQGAIVGLEKVDQLVLKALPDLQIIAKYGVGLDNVDIEFAKAQGKAIGWTGGVNRLSVAEQTLGFMIGLCRNLFNSHCILKQGIWERFGGVQLSGKTVGIVGCGFIGSEVLKLLKPFECELLICDILDKSEFMKQYDAQQVAFHDLIGTADVITLHVPLTPSTRHLIGTIQLEQMKSSAFLINTSRGAVVNQSALKEALQHQKIAGAALDVFEEEPPYDLELLALPNLVTTPHIAGNAQESVVAMGRSAIRHLQTFFYGES